MFSKGFDLPKSKSRPRIKTHNGQTLTTFIDEPTTSRLKKFTNEIIDKYLLDSILEPTGGISEGLRPPDQPLIDNIDTVTVVNTIINYHEDK